MSITQEVDLIDEFNYNRIDYYNTVLGKDLMILARYPGRRHKL